MIKIPVAIFVNIDKPTLEFIGKSKETKKLKQFLKIVQLERITPLDFKTSSKATVSKSGIGEEIDRNQNHWNTRRV